MFVDGGFGPAIIQNKELKETDLVSIFNYTFLFGMIIGILFSFFGYFISYFYNNIIYLNISRLLSISIIFYGMNIVPTAILNKEKRFKHLSYIQLASSSLSGFIGVVAAWLGYGVYSLVFMTIANSIISFILLKKISEIKYRFIFDISPIKSIWFFSKNQFLFNFINYFSRNTDNLLIGRFLGNEALGNYSKAYQLLMYPNTILLGVISPVLQPVLKDYQDNPLKIKEVYLKVIHLLAFIGLPLSVFLATSSREIIYFMFGKQWTDAILPFAILSTTVWIQMTLSSSGAIFQARNKPELLLKNGMISSMIIIPSIIIGLILGSINKVAFCITIGFYLNFFVSFHLVMKNALEDRFISLFREFLKPGIVAFVELISMLLISEFMFIENVFYSLLIRGSIFIVIFIITNVLLGEIQKIKNLYSN